MIGPTTLEQHARAMRLYKHARYAGELTPPDACEHCGKATGTGPSTALHGHHHNGYDDEHALDVIWLCNPCHQHMHPATPYVYGPPPPPSPLMTIGEAAAYLNLSVGTLRKWRSERRGPTSMKLGKRVQYDRADLDRWIAEQKGQLSE